VDSNHQNLSLSRHSISINKKLSNLHHTPS
jgi:hypothetical protein